MNNKIKSLLIIITIMLSSFSIISNASIIKHSIKQDVVYKNTNKQIYLGYVKINGNGSNSNLEAVAKNNLLVDIENKTDYVDFYINYTMNCSGDTDNGQIWLTVAINGQNMTPALATTFNIAEGVLKIEDIQVNRKDGFQFLIEVIYANVIPLYTNQTQAIGGGFIRKSTKLIEKNNIIPYTTFFTNITAEEAYNLIKSTENLTVVDIRGLEGCGICQFNHGHLPGAQRNDNPTTLYEKTTDILVYSINGSVGVDFCLDLLNHVYGKIYNLIGGYNAWVAAGYPLEGSPTYLQIMNLDSGLGSVSVEIKNIGSFIARDISVEIKVVGGFFSFINFTSSCINCENSLEPGVIKTEGSSKDGYIFGFGPIEITVSAWAKNAGIVTIKQEAFIFGLIIVIKVSGYGDRYKLEGK